MSLEGNHTNTSVVENVENSWNGFFWDEIFNDNERDTLYQFLGKGKITLAYEVFYKNYRTFEKKILKSNSWEPKMDEELKDCFIELFSDYLFDYAEDIEPRLETAIIKYFPDIDASGKAYIKKKFAMLYIPKTIKSFEESFALVASADIELLAIWLRDATSSLGIGWIVFDFLSQYTEEDKKFLEGTLASYFTERKQSLMESHPGTKIKVYFNKNNYCKKENMKQYCRESITYSFVYGAQEECRAIMDAQPLSVNDLLVVYFHNLYEFEHLEEEMKKTIVYEYIYQCIDTQLSNALEDIQEKMAQRSKESLPVSSSSDAMPWKNEISPSLPANLSSSLPSKRYPNILFDIAHNDKEFLAALKRDYNMRRGDGTSGKISFFTLKNHFSNDTEIQEITEKLWEAGIDVIQSQEPVTKATNNELLSTITETEDLKKSPTPRNRDLEKFRKFRECLDCDIGNKDREKLAKKLYTLCTLVGIKVYPSKSVQEIYENFMECITPTPGKYHYDCNIGVLVDKLEKLYDCENFALQKGVVKLLGNGYFAIEIGGFYRLLLYKWDGSARYYLIAWGILNHDQYNIFLDNYVCPGKVPG